jgi:hypothetical protein
VSQRRKAAQVMEDLRRDLVEAKQKQAAASLQARTAQASAASPSVEQQDESSRRRARARRRPARSNAFSSSSSSSSLSPAPARNAARECNRNGYGEEERVDLLEEREALLEKLRQCRLLLADGERVLEHVSRKRDLAIKRQRYEGERCRVTVKTLLEAFALLLRRHGLISAAWRQSADAVMARLGLPADSASASRVSGRQLALADSIAARGHSGPGGGSGDDGMDRSYVSEKSHVDVAALLSDAFSWLHDDAVVGNGSGSPDRDVADCVVAGNCDRSEVMHTSDGDNSLMEGHSVIDWGLDT